MPNLHGQLPLRLRVDELPREAESTYSYAGGGTVLVLSTTLPDRQFALELISTYTGFPGGDTHATHLLRSAQTDIPQIHTVTHSGQDHDPSEHARECVYDHLHHLIDALNDGGHSASAQLNDRTFAALEAVE